MTAGTLECFRNNTTMGTPSPSAALFMFRLVALGGDLASFPCVWALAGVMYSDITVPVRAAVSLVQTQRIRLQFPAALAAEGSA